MAKLIELQEAAKMLGVTPEELTEMRSRNEIFGYRDGSTWKFKETEIERLAIERGITLSMSGVPTSDASDDLDIDLSDSEALSIDDDESGSTGSDSILVSEEALGKSEDTTSSTIIGKTDPLGSEASDIQLADTEEEGSALRLADDSDVDPGGSDILAQESDILAGSGSIELNPSDTANFGR